MEPSMPTEVEGDHKERKKIQFDVPASAPTNLDPRQVEMAFKDSVFTKCCSVQRNAPLSRLMSHDLISSSPLSQSHTEIRRRRPTPATLFRVADQPSPEDDQSTHQVKWVVGENGVLKPKRVNPNVYQPPSLKDHQETATTEHFPSMTAMTNKTETPKEEDEEDEEEDDKEENKLEKNRRECN
ncbi:protein phosphatase 1 regulatory subunit 1B isoform X5 [Nothobranchius furzeri]|uniref:Protein phosphatase 1 regulatory subunit 1B n=1 Tax=Nothobranchius furzeri TaxID=105023 RepID=A0A9D3BY76_NOTFU|nr:transcript variant X5 [Nothobranchius furzeri]